MNVKKKLNMGKKLNFKMAMDFKKIAGIGAIAVMGLASCKKEGCTDSTATNYDSTAKKDDGTCLYKDPVDTTTPPPVVLKTTEYVFGINTMEGVFAEIYPTTNIAKDGADSTVGTIKIKSDGISLANANWTASDLLIVLDQAFTAANGKGTGDNTKINGIDASNVTDSLKLVSYKYRVNE
jgi:hypothetical protein